jgi:hypothetical protein
MGYDIYSENGKLGQSLNIVGWMSLRGLARIFGWDPQGTVLMSWKDNKTGEIFPPVCIHPDNRIDGQWVKDDTWSGSYSSNDFQEITADDAKNFANALEKALEYMAGDRASEIGTVEELDEDGWDEDSLVARKNLIGVWSGLDVQERIKGFIKLFKAGACHIL